MATQSSHRLELGITAATDPNVTPLQSHAAQALTSSIWQEIANVEAEFEKKKFADKKFEEKNILLNEMENAELKEVIAERLFELHAQEEQEQKTEERAEKEKIHYQQVQEDVQKNNQAQMQQKEDFIKTLEKFEIVELKEQLKEAKENVVFAQSAVNKAYEDVARFDESWRSMQAANTSKLAGKLGSEFIGKLDIVDKDGNKPQLSDAFKNNLKKSAPASPTTAARINPALLKLAAKQYVQGSGVMWEMKLIQDMCKDLSVKYSASMSAKMSKALTAMKALPGVSETQLAIAMVEKGFEIVKDLTKKELNLQQAQHSVYAIEKQIMQKEIAAVLTAECGDNLGHQDFHRIKDTLAKSMGVHFSHVEETKLNAFIQNGQSTADVIAAEALTIALEHNLTEKEKNTHLFSEALHKAGIDNVAKAIHNPINELKIIHALSDVTGVRYSPSEIKELVKTFKTLDEVAGKEQPEEIVNAAHDIAAKRDPSKAQRSSADPKQMEKNIDMFQKISKRLGEFEPQSPSVGPAGPKFGG